MKLKIIVIFVLICCILSSCTPHTKKNKYSTQTFEYFDTVSVITGYASTKAEFVSVADDIISQLAEYHRLYSIYHRFEGINNLCTVNESADGAHRRVKVDRSIIDMLLYAVEMQSLTHGKFNVAMGSVLSLWHDYRTVGNNDPSKASLPPTELLLKAAEHTDITKMHIDETNNTVFLTDSLMSLDVGALAKGYATESIARYLEKKGITGYVLNIGGNIRTIGAKPDGCGWRVGIEDPCGDGYLAYLKLSGQSVVTSGSYQRYYTVDGIRYHHIIDPETLMPAKGFKSVSVISYDSGLSDALSTALFCMTHEEGVSLVETISGVEAMWVRENGELLLSSGWESYTE